MKSLGVVYFGFLFSVIISTFPSASTAGGFDRAAVASRLDELESLADQLYSRVRFLHDQYSRDVDITVGEFERRFSEAEINFLLENYTAAVVYLYEVVDTPKFIDAPRYDDALYYLAESLYQLESFLPARGFFLSLVNRGPSRYEDEALLRLMEISGRVRDYTDVEEIYRRVLMAGRSPRPEVRYVFGKFLFAREDLEDTERWERSIDAFASVPLESSQGLAARHYLGTVYVQQARVEWERAQSVLRASPEARLDAEAVYRDRLANALDIFLEVVEQPAANERQRKIQEQSWLAVGRIYQELGLAPEAIDAYQRIHRHSSFYFESLYEVAWAFIKKGDLENARRSAEILLTGTGDSPLAPEIKLLLGHLHARANRYDRAILSYDEVIVEYAPVRQEIDDLLRTHEDPVSHFSDIISSAGGSFDVELILPPIAARWAATREEVDRGMAIVNNLALGHVGIDEGREIAKRILASLDGGTLEPFPELAEGHRNSKQAQSEILKSQSLVGSIENELLEHRVPSDLQAAYDRARLEREEAEIRFQVLPATPEEMEDRREGWLATVERVHREAFRSRMEVQSLLAQMAAMRKLIRDQKKELHASEQDLNSFMMQLDRETEELTNLEDQATAFMRQLDLFADAVRADTAVAGARNVIDKYEKALDAERKLFSQVREAIGATDAELSRVDRIRGRLVPASEMVKNLIADIERRGAYRRQILRERVLAETDRLDEYSNDVLEVQNQTRDLVGRIAYASVRGVREKLFELVLRSDVGIIDVAWAQKSDRSLEIQQLVEDKDKQLRALENDFMDIIRDPGAEIVP